MIQKNHPKLWKDKLPRPAKDGHKYDRGYAAIYGAPELTGATRLAASACARMGAGLTVVIAEDKSADIYRKTLPAHIMVRDDLSWFDPRVSVVLYGPGGVPVPVDIKENMKMVLDADALANLPKALNENIVLTPHDGEFEKAFPDLAGTRMEKALLASQACGAVIVLKGAETIITHPDGRQIVNNHASPYLASAGTGDVLAGMLTGLLSQGMNCYDASCAAVWMHGECGRRVGPGLVASDLIDIIPEVLKELLE